MTFHAGALAREWH